jgi:uncharacterized membrane protein
MSKKDTMIGAALGSLLAIGTLAAATQANAQDQKMEKCYGVVKAGKNDCAGAGHTCQGQAKTDGSPQEFILVPAGTCDRLVNGSTMAKKSSM